jgi:hypothetical protein
VSANPIKPPTTTQAVDQVLIISGLIAAAASEQALVSMAGLCGMIQVLCPSESPTQIKKKKIRKDQRRFRHPANKTSSILL